MGKILQYILLFEQSKQYMTYYLVFGSFAMVFNATFNNISVISWRSVLLMEETGEIHQPATGH
jgi:hypothetical protein